VYGHKFTSPASETSYNPLGPTLPDPKRTNIWVRTLKGKKIKTEGRIEKDKKTKR
jgi:hypothetical protein